MDNRLMINYAVSCLNSAYEKDPQAILALMNNRVPANRLVTHPYVVVHAEKEIGDDLYSVGPLGVINGMFTAMGLPRIAMEYDNGRFVRFVKWRPDERTKEYT